MDLTESYEAQQLRANEGEPEGFVVVDMRACTLIGVGDDVEEAIAYAREERDCEDEGCCYCGHDADESMWLAYRVHPRAYALVKDPWSTGDSLWTERLTWDAERQHLRYHPRPECPVCMGHGYYRERDERGGYRRPPCNAGCDHGSLPDPEESLKQAPSWFVPPPVPPLGSVWQGKVSPCLQRARELKAKLDEAEARERRGAWR